ncbi:MFS transporter [Anatilimnocola floriformis]|uniref:MFS transporter n=1 Tax=Anatilimnocola floriformis TaxID=2948575 RepID=UPI0020C1C419|nr:MFS transporter [Anatilimnocola floriformis]
MNEAKPNPYESPRHVDVPTDLPDGAKLLHAERPVTRKEIVAWALCDWANSAYSTLSITLLVNYITKLAIPENQPITAFGMEITGLRVWTWGLGISMFCAALMSPILGAMADARASKWKWLISTSFLGAICATLIPLAPVAQPWLIIGLFFVTSLSFELSFGFYNGFLPELADDESMNRLSGIGFAAGYLGGGLALAVVLVLFAIGGSIGLPDLPSRARAGLVVMGLWWGLFMIPAALWLRDRAKPRNIHAGMASTAFHAVGQVLRTLQNVRAYSVLSIFLAGFLIYNEGIQTVMSQAGYFGEKVLAMSASELMLLVLMIQMLAAPAALGVGWLSDRIGAKTTLLVCLAIWCALLVGAYFVSTKPQFWVMGVVVALVMGGTQAVGRSMMGVMTPEAKTAEFMGFFNLSARATSMVGPILFGEVMHATGSANAAILSLLSFIIIGMAVVSFVNLRRGIEQARAG